MRATDGLNYLIDRAAFSRRLNYLAGSGSQGSALAATPQMPVGSSTDTSLDGAVARLPFASLDDMFGEPGRERIGELIADCARGWRWATDTLLPQELAAAAPDLYLLGLASPMIAAAELYLQQPCLYLGATLKVERVAPAAGTRLWHLDVEDVRMLRVLVYLNDVGEGNGPLQVLPPDLSARVRSALGYRSGFVSDAQLAAIVPASAWVSCSAKAGDALFFDGTRLFHRAQPPILGERYSLTFSYATRRPLQIYRKARLLGRTQKELVGLLAPDLRPYIPRARAF